MKASFLLNNHDKKKKKNGLQHGSIRIITMCCMRIATTKKPSCLFPIFCAFWKLTKQRPHYSIWLAEKEDIAST